MVHGSLNTTTMLGITLSNVMSRHRFDTEAQQVVDELRAIAGDRGDVLAMEVGLWVGYHGGDEHVGPLIAALQRVDGIGHWVEVGKHRRGIPNHAYNQPNKTRPDRAHPRPESTSDR